MLFILTSRLFLREPWGSAEIGGSLISFSIAAVAFMVAHRARNAGETEPLSDGNRG